MRLSVPRCAAAAAGRAVAITAASRRPASSRRRLDGTHARAALRRDATPRRGARHDISLPRGLYRPIGNTLRCSREYLRIMPVFFQWFHRAMCTYHVFFLLLMWCDEWIIPALRACVILIKYGNLLYLEFIVPSIDTIYLSLFLASTSSFDEEILCFFLSGT